MSNSGPLSLRTRRPPAIPRVRSSGSWDRGEHLLLWVRTGSAAVRMGDDPEFCLGEGEGVWVPSKIGVSWTVVTEPGTVAFPLLMHPGIAVDASSESRRFTIPEGWQDWLIQHFNLQVTPLSGRGYSHDALADLLRRSGARPPETARGGVPETPTPRDAVVMPKSLGSRAVADELLRDPAIELTVSEWAARVLSSPRTLRRDFLSATGLTFEQWRLRRRLDAAIDFLMAGYEVDQVVARVGFASRSGFTRAFKQHFGATPHEFGRRLAAEQVTGAVSGRVTVARQADDLVRMMRGGDATTTAPELLPAARTPPHANDAHVLSWMYRGSGYLDIDGRRYERQRGVATWIPAEREHITGLRENSISLPIGTAGTGDLSLTVPLRVQFPPAWGDYLMFCAISSRSPLRPEDYDPRRIVDLFAEQLAEQQALTLPLPAHPSARAAALRYLRLMGVSTESEFDLPADVQRAFRDETGMTFSRWRYAARMRIARDLLAGGAKPGSVARRVGYAHLPTFSAAFSRFHGMSPREYRDRQVEVASP